MHIHARLGPIPATRVNPTSIVRDRNPAHSCHYHITRAKCLATHSIHRFPRVTAPLGSAGGGTSWVMYSGSVSTDGGPVY